MAFEARALIPDMGIWGSPLSRKKQNRQFLREEIAEGGAEKLLSILNHFHAPLNGQPYTQAQTEILSDQKTIIRLWKNLKSNAGFLERIKTWWIALQALKGNLHSAGKLATKVAALLKESNLAPSSSEINSVIKAAVAEACNLYNPKDFFLTKLYEVAYQAATKVSFRAGFYWTAAGACRDFLNSLAKSPASSTNTSPLSSPSTSRSASLSSNE